MSRHLLDIYVYKLQTKKKNLWKKRRPNVPLNALGFRYIRRVIKVLQVCEHIEHKSNT